jgi:hypothetical protein
MLGLDLVRLGWPALRVALQLGVRLKLMLAIWSRLGFHRVFQTASRKQIGNLQNLAKLEKQAHHPKSKRNCLNPFLDQYIQCVIEGESALNCRRQIGSLRRTPFAIRPHRDLLPRQDIAVIDSSPWPSPAQTGRGSGWATRLTSSRQGHALNPPMNHASFRSGGSPRSPMTPAPFTPRS